MNTGCQSAQISIVIAAPVWIETCVTSLSLIRISRLQNVFLAAIVRKEPLMDSEQLQASQMLWSTSFTATEKEKGTEGSLNITAEIVHKIGNKTSVVNTTGCINGTISHRALISCDDKWT